MWSYRLTASTHPFLTYEIIRWTKRYIERNEKSPFSFYFSILSHETSREKLLEYTPPDRDEKCEIFQ